MPNRQGFTILPFPQRLHFCMSCKTLLADFADMVILVSRQSS